MGSEPLDDQLIGGMIASLVTGIAKRLKPHWQSTTVLLLFLLVAAATALLVWASEIFAMADQAWRAYSRVMAVVLSGLGAYEAQRTKPDTEPKPENPTQNRVNVPQLIEKKG